MRMIDLLIGALAVALVVFTVVYNVRKRRRGDVGCAYCDGCKSAKKKDCHK